MTRVPGSAVAAALVGSPLRAVRAGRQAVSRIVQLALDAERVVGLAEQVVLSAGELIVGLAAELARIDGVVTGVELQTLRVDGAVTVAGEVISALGATGDAADERVRDLGTTIGQARDEIVRLGDLIGQADAGVDRLGGVVERADTGVDRLAGVVSGGSLAVERLDAVISRSGDAVALLRAMLDLLDPAVRDGAPLLQTLAEGLTTRDMEQVPVLLEEVHAAMPDVALLREVAESMVPMVTELQQTLSGLPGAARLKKRAKQHAEEAAD